MNDYPATVRFLVDTTNPGQFFACCGLLEMADRIWSGAEGWFSGQHFCLRSVTPGRDSDGESLISALGRCVLTNTMTDADRNRLEAISAMKGSDKLKLEDEKKALEKQRRENPIRLLEPLNMRIDWFQDGLSGGSRFKTWAGQQSVLDIAADMKAPINRITAGSHSVEEFLHYSTTGCGLPFYFDSDIGSQGAALDIGFSFDPLAGSDVTRIETTVRPCLEFCAFVGLQRFRPDRLRTENRYVYCLWDRPLTPEVAAAAACGAFRFRRDGAWQFQLLFRTKYLKSFLPAIPYTGVSDE